MRVMSAGDGYKYLLRTVAAGDGDRSLSTPLTRYYNADGTPKPSYAALRDLIKGEWWLAPTTARTDADGRVAVRGFLGEYRVADVASSSAAEFELVQGDSVRRLRLAAGGS